MSTLPAEEGNARIPKFPDDLERWLSIMKAHGYSKKEMSAATGLREEDIPSADQISTFHFPKNRLRTLPYPGGRHPRIGFLDGAV
ncbi:MAG: hypothetical protein KDM64_19000, partial [Verrucomicrobiae bacterium]|nr:hypothetical protein [Verrucomicrobiae bacterium]